jgi:hypothetical protein
MLQDNIRTRTANFPNTRSEAPGGQLERRSEKRHVALLRVAVLHVAGERDLCVVRNISTHGLSARLYRDLARRTEVEVEFRSGERLKGAVVWKKNQEVGIRFPNPVNVETVLASRWLVESGRRRNLPRIELSSEARLKGSHHHAVELQDISQGGARVRIDCPLELGRVVLILPRMSPVAGVVRWTADGIAGISFDECVAFDQLAGWLEERRRAESKSGRTA